MGAFHVWHCKFSGGGGGGGGGGLWLIQALSVSVGSSIVYKIMPSRHKVLRKCPKIFQNCPKSTLKYSKSTLKYSKSTSEVLQKYSKSVLSIFTWVYGYAGIVGLRIFREDFTLILIINNLIIRHLIIIVHSLSSGKVEMFLCAAYHAFTPHVNAWKH